MFNLPALDIAVTLSFTYFLVSLITSSLNEFVYSVLSRRSKMLKHAIRHLYFEDAQTSASLYTWKQYVEAKVFTSPQIQSLQKRVDKFPSYIPAKNFATALLDSLRRGDQVLDMTELEKDLTDATSPLPQKVRLSLLSMFERAQGDLIRFQSEVESFYNNSMDRVAGIYKRETTYVIFVISLIIACAGNIDTIHITDSLWKDPEKLKVTTDQIVKAAKTIHADSTGFSNEANDSARFSGIHATYEITKIDPKDNTNRKITVSLDNAAAAGQIMVASSLPLGWTKENRAAEENLFTRIMGFLITAVAVMLGAPFWFELMNKFINLRATGKKPEEEKK
jgi:hypothetical protein